MKQLNIIKTIKNKNNLIIRIVQQENNYYLEGLNIFNEGVPDSTHSTLKAAELRIKQGE